MLVPRRLGCSGGDQGGDAERATKCGDYDETGGGREDGLNLGSDERACTYIGGMNYVAFTGGGEQT